MSIPKINIGDEILVRMPDSRLPDPKSWTVYRCIYVRQGKADDEIIVKIYGSEFLVKKENFVGKMNTL